MNRALSKELVDGMKSVRDAYDFTDAPLSRVSRWLEDANVDQLVLTGSEWVRWLSGYACYGAFPAAVVLRRGEAPVLLLSGLEEARARGVPAASSFAFLSYGDLGFGLLRDADAAMASAYAAFGVPASTKVAAVDSGWLSNGDVALEIADASAAMSDLRMVKSLSEIEEIARRVELVWSAQRAIGEALERGASEIELFALAHATMEVNWGAPLEMTADVVGGANCAGIGAPVNVPGPRVIEPGEALIADVAIIASGYCADLTWTHVRGANPELEELRDRLIDVRTTIVEGLVPGRACSDVYREMSELVAQAAPGHTFTHHGGHGLGLAFYEAPFFTPWCDIELREGMTVAVEPGAYEARHGVRVENNYVVTTAGGFEIPGRPADLGRRS